MKAYDTELDAIKQRTRVTRNLFDVWIKTKIYFRVYRPNKIVAHLSCSNQQRH
jgi:hypothetical protein